MAGAAGDAYKLQPVRRDLGSTQSLVDTKKQQRPAIKQGTPCDGVWRDQPESRDWPQAKGKMVALIARDVHVRDKAPRR